MPFAANAQVEAKVARPRPATLQQFAERAATAPLIAETGTRWSYSMGLDVLAAVVEKCRACRSSGSSRPVSSRR